MPLVLIGNFGLPAQVVLSEDTDMMVELQGV